MALNPAFKGNRGVAGVAAGGAVLLPPPLLPPPTTWSTAALLWFRNFSSRRHFALRLLNHTCNRRNDGAFVTIRGVVTPSDAALALSRTPPSLHVSPLLPLLPPRSVHAYTFFRFSLPFICFSPLTKHSLHAFSRYSLSRSFLYFLVTLGFRYSFSSVLISISIN